MSSPEQAGGCDRVVEPLEPAPPRKLPTRRRRRSGVAAVPTTRRQCANGPAPMDIRSAIEVESPVTSWKPSLLAHRRQLQTQSRQCSGVRRSRGHVHRTGRTRWTHLHPSHPPHRSDTVARRAVARRTAAVARRGRRHDGGNQTKVVPGLMRPTTREARTQFVPTVIAFAVGAVVSLWPATS
jgi:hypothetical protein